MARTTSEGSVPAGTLRSEPSGSVRVSVLSDGRSFILRRRNWPRYCTRACELTSRVSSFEVIVAQQLPPQDSTMPRFRFHDDEASSTSTIVAVLAAAVGGFALGMFVAQRVGGLEGLKSKLTARRGGGDIPRPGRDDDEFDDVETDDIESEDYDE